MLSTTASVICFCQALCKLSRARGRGASCHEQGAVVQVVVSKGQLCRCRNRCGSFHAWRRGMVNVRSTGVWSKSETALQYNWPAKQKSSNGVCWRAYTSGRSCRGLWGPAPAVVAPALGVCVLPGLCRFTREGFSSALISHYVA